MVNGQLMKEKSKPLKPENPYWWKTDEWAITQQVHLVSNELIGLKL